MIYSKTEDGYIFCHTNKKYYKNFEEFKQDELLFLESENDRLNNIIEELEKYIKDFANEYRTNNFQPKAKVYIYYKDILDKLKALKED